MLNPKSSSISASIAKEKNLEGTFSINWKLNLFLMFVSLIPPLLCLFFIFNYSVNIPFWGDEWNIVSLIHKVADHSLKISDLYTLNNQHRHIFTRILYILDYKFFRWNEFTLLLFNFFVQFLLLIWIFLKTKTFDFAAREKNWLLIPIFSLLLFSPQVAEIWYSSYLTSFPLGALFIFLTVFSLTYSARNKSSLLLTLLLALFSSATLFNGLLVWPIIILMLFLGGASWRLISCYVLTGAVVIYTYVQGVDFKFSPNDGNVLSAIYSHIIFFITFIGAIFGKNVTYAKDFGIVGIILYSLCSYFIWKMHLPKEQLRKLLPWFGISFFTIGSGILASLGRSDVIYEAITSRYIETEVFFWIALIVLSYYLIHKNWNYIYNKKLLYLVLVLVALIFITGYHSAANDKIVGGKIVQQAINLESLAVSNNSFIINADSNFETLSTTPQQIIPSLDFVRENKLLLFNQNKADQNLGKSIYQYKISAEKLPATFNAIKSSNQHLELQKYNFSPALKISGSVKSTNKIDKIYMTDSKGKIVGIGMPTFYQASSKETSWYGIVLPNLADRKDSSIYAYVQFADTDELIRLDSAQSLPKTIEKT